MDDFKVENFRRSHPGISPPTFKKLDVQSAKTLRSRIASRVGLPVESDGLRITTHIVEKSTRIASADANSKDFNLRRLLTDLGIQALEWVYINWYRYDDIDAIQLTDLSHFFSDIWYCDSDDIEIFDESCDWIVMISHSGEVGLIVHDSRLPEGNG